MKNKPAKKNIRAVASGIVSVNASFNNTIVTITDPQGNVLVTASSGSCGFKGSRKSTPYAAQIAAETACKKVVTVYGMKTVSVRVKGVGSGRESALRGVHNSGLNVTIILDITSLPHNGCRRRKNRRV
ncbi:MAG: 30S ribosomal protein S11 [Alphaproteobacteria bacterium]|nr:30S ribosomal protein S11 [Alphaproteobacteria bacterium]